MNFHIFSIFPDFFKEYFKFGILSRAVENRVVNIHLYNLRDYSEDKRLGVDDRIAGGGKGMLFKAPILQKAVRNVRENFRNCKVIYLTPQGKVFNNRMAKELSGYENILLICGRYEGIDGRFVEKEVDLEISIGDYVLTGGELPALVLIDAICRFVGDTVKSQALKEESFENDLLEYEHYTVPNEWEGIKIPEVLRSGNHKAIKEYRFYSSLKKTYFNRIDLLERFSVSYLKDKLEVVDFKNLKKQNKILKEYLFNIQKIAKEWRYVRRNSDSE
ncbi:MAG: tRNA (guanosine(37)-N1)-methyltransferase TrmD [Brevinematales bacterium]|nr:tRNA (guanosine(37)-N1)-methyltransferase TrmD [Brevinematales bacterium]